MQPIGVENHLCRDEGHRGIRRDLPGKKISGQVFCNHHYRSALENNSIGPRQESAVPEVRTKVASVIRPSIEMVRQQLPKCSHSVLGHKMADSRLRDTKFSTKIWIESVVIY